jgi:hypothetical protein
MATQPIYKITINCSQSGFSVREGKEQSACVLKSARNKAKSVTEAAKEAFTRYSESLAELSEKYNPKTEPKNPNYRYVLKKPAHNQYGYFLDAVKITMKLEGGLGKERCGANVNYGITQTTLNALKSQGKYKNYPQSVKYLTPEQAKAIYYKEYWLAAGADKIENKTLAVAYFDACVNMGVGRGKKIFREYNEFVKNFKKNHSVDEVSGESAQTMAFNMIRQNHYGQLIKGNQKLAQYKQGWNNRMSNLDRHLRSIV